MTMISIRDLVTLSSPKDNTFFKMGESKQKYLFLYLRTGGGHLAPARSVAKYLSEQHGEEITPVLIDGLAQAKSIARYVIEDG
ncbi:MAG: hypothetical protein M0R68_14990, partial [Bacteroidetes bacterium]|nr:hypothetical protein [Bacteroidota bacterium]